jgi:hypothetical protein
MEPLSVHLVMTTLPLNNVDGGTFGNRHNHYCAAHILATVAHYVEILALRCW